MFFDVSGWQKFMAGIPSAALEAGIPGIKEFSLTSRLLCPFIKFLEYSLAGITCGLLGQGVANSLMLLRCAGWLLAKLHMLFVCAC